MTLYAAPDFDQHEQVLFCYDPELEIKAIIAIHNTHLGPALGGCRLWPYGTEQEAVYDVLRLSQGMTYKAAVADLKLGGGKMVVIGDSRQPKPRAFFNKIGEFVESLKGSYITAEDVGVSVENVTAIREKTQHVVGVPDGFGDPSPFTAYGIYQGMLASVAHQLGRPDLDGLKIIVQGLGSVGYNLSKHLHKAGAKLYVYDIHQPFLDRAIDEFNATAITDREVFTKEADVYAPCALGATLNSETIPALNVKVVCGGANNQLQDATHGRQLRQRGILYAPDYVVNQGGLVCVWYETHKKPEHLIYQHIDALKDTLTEVFALSEEEHLSTAEAANRIAEKRFKPKKRPFHQTIGL